MWSAVLLAVALAADGRLASVHGVLLEWEGDARAGQFSVRAADHRVHVFLFDAGTAVEREGRRTAMLALLKGDMLVVSCDAADRGLRRYARSVVVAVPALPRGPLPSWNPRELPNTAGVPARGRIFLSGVIAHVEPDRLYLRTRTHDEQVILLREDTSLTGDGLPSEPASLRVNMHVFVRAGRTAEGELEAFQVVWGRILPAR